MPRKTKEQKELEEKKELKIKPSEKAKKTTTAKTKTTKATATTKKASTSNAKSTTKAAATTKKASTSKAKTKTTKATATTKKASTSKAKSTTKAAATTKKASTSKAKTKTTKATATTKKASTSKAKTKTTKATATTKKTSASKAKTKTTKATATTKKASASKAKSTTKATPTAKKTSTSKVAKKDSLLDLSLSVAEYYDLPYRYNKTVVKILAQTPSTLFVYWEISDEDIENYKKQYGENFFEITKPVLIVYNKTLDYSFEIEINDFANSWYLKVNNSKCEYKIELGRRPIQYNEKINNDYIYVATSNDIEAPNDHILIEDFPNEIIFRNVKTNFEYSRKLTELAINKNIRKIYDIYDLYKLIYQDENIDDIYDLSNPASGGNPSSGSFSSRFM